MLWRGRVKMPLLQPPKKRPYMIMQVGQPLVAALTLHVAARMLDCGGPKSTLYAGSHPWTTLLWLHNG